MCKILVTLFYLLIASHLQAAELVTILASDSIPPYVMADERLKDKLPGLQVEIVNTVFNELAMKTRWKFMTNNRMIVQFVKKGVDAALNIPFMINSDKAYGSDPILHYRNCVIGRTELKETWLRDLKMLKILGHQKADDIYRETFGDYDFKNKKYYNEVTSQKTLAYHAVSHRTDLVLSDALVLTYYAKKYFEAQFNRSQLVCLKEIKSPRSLGFKNEKLRDEFNRGLKKIKADGRYQAILDKYLKLFPSL